jgi:hypothetical protein
MGNARSAGRKRPSFECWASLLRNAAHPATVTFFTNSPNAVLDLRSSERALPYRHIGKWFFNVDSAIESIVEHSRRKVLKIRMHPLRKIMFARWLVALSAIYAATIRSIPLIARHLQFFLTHFSQISWMEESCAPLKASLPAQMQASLIEAGSGPANRDRSCPTAARSDYHGRMRCSVLNS